MAIILHLMELLLEKGWITGSDRTLKMYRKGVPKAIKGANVKQGEIIAQHSGPVAR
jgi:hypothetical protein